MTTSNIIDLTDEEISNKISEIYKKLRIINTLPKKDTNTINQLYILLDQYLFEKDRRNLKEDDGNNIVLDTEEIPVEKHNQTQQPKTKKNVIKKPTNFNKVYKKKEQ